jgi:hypothetical protein
LHWSDVTLYGHEFMQRTNRNSISEIDEIVQVQIIYILTMYKRWPLFRNSCK